MRKPCATTLESMPCAQFVGHFRQKIKSNGQSNANRRILPDSALSPKSKESRKSLIFRILPRIAFACCGPTWNCTFAVSVLIFSNFYFENFYGHWMDTEADFAQTSI